MGIETSLERIATALERIASTQEENTKINAWYKNHLATLDALKAGEYGPIDGPKVETALAEAHVEAAPEVATSPVCVDTPVAPATDAPAAPEMTFDELKAALAARGHVYPKGTKATTLRKEWEKYKNTAPVDVATPDNVVVMRPLAPQDAPASEAPAAEPADPFGLPAAPAPEQKPAMTKDEAAARIRANYKATEEDRKAFIEALAAAGVPAGGSFQDVQDGKFDVLVETYERLKGTATNA